MRRRARVDANHRQIADAFRKCGWRVNDCSRIGSGFPDLVIEKSDRVEFIEVKDGRQVPSRRVLTDQEVQMHGWLRKAGVDVKVIKSAEEAVRL